MATEELFTIDDDIRNIAISGFSSLIRQIGKKCELHYPPTWITDSAVVVDPIGGKPASRWITGEAGSPDPTVDTSGKRAVEVVEIVTMLIAWGRRDFFIKPEWNIAIPEGSVQTKGFMADAAKVLKADYMILQKDLNPRFNLKYRRVGDLVDVSNITPNVFFIASWERIQ